LGLHHAHTAVDAAGQPLHIVHRDISPQNLMVRDDGVTKVVDFGVASYRPSRPGAPKGKPGYMAPEQLLGEPLTSATDQFALGVVLWEMTCGRRLFQGEQEAELIKKVTEAEIPAPSDLVPGLSPELDAITLRMLDRDPDRRFRNCDEVARAFDQFLIGQSDGGGKESPVALYLKSLGPADSLVPLLVTPSKGVFVPASMGFTPQPAAQILASRTPTRAISVLVGLLAVGLGAGAYLAAREYRTPRSPASVKVAPARGVAVKPDAG
jgi:serine/threonine protein kinase